MDLQPDGTPQFHGADGYLRYGGPIPLTYGSLMHLAPAFVGFALVIIGLALSYPYLMGLDVEHYKRWKELLK